MCNQTAQIVTWTNLRSDLTLLTQESREMEHDTDRRTDDVCVSLLFSCLTLILAFLAFFSPHAEPVDPSLVHMKPQTRRIPKTSAEKGFSVKIIQNRLGAGIWCV